MKLKERMIDQLQEILNIKDDIIFTVTYPDERKERYQFSEHKFYLEKIETGYLDESNDWLDIISNFETLKIEVPNYTLDDNDKYWRIGIKSFASLYDDRYRIECVKYEDDLLNKLCVNMGNCFRTKEEAQKHKEEIVKKINSKL